MSEVLDRVEKGERITITRRGKPVAEIGPHTHNQETCRQQKWLEFTDALPYQEVSAGDSFAQCVTEIAIEFLCRYVGYSQRNHQ